MKIRGNDRLLSCKILDLLEPNSFPPEYFPCVGYSDVGNDVV